MLTRLRFSASKREVVGRSFRDFGGLRAGEKGAKISTLSVMAVLLFASLG